ncbi:cold-shock protein [Salinispirillum sp. LH 10-3-1]
MNAVSIIVGLVISFLAAIAATLVVVFWQGNPVSLAFSQDGFWASVASVWALMALVLMIMEFLPLEAREDLREEGVVKWFNGAKGFGFITRDNDEDVFVHFRSIRGRGHRTLHEGQRVKFGVVESAKGLQAEDVSVVRHQ